MTPDQLSRIEQMASGSPTWDLSPNDLAALKAILAERQAIVGHCQQHNHSGVSPSYQLACIRVLELAGERPEGEGGK